MSIRKPYNRNSGYVSSRRNPYTGDFNVLYRAEEAGLCPQGGPWVTVCEAHSTVCNHSSLKMARHHLPYPGWCEACMAKASIGDSR